MISKLERQLQDGLVILDTNITWAYPDSLSDILYNGRSGLSKITEEMVESSVKRLGELEDLADTGKLVVLREVLDELNAGYLSVDRNLKYIREDPYRRHEDSQYSSIFRQLHEYNFARMKFQKRVSRNEFRIGFDDGEDHCDEINRCIEDHKRKFVETLDQDLRSSYFKAIAGDKRLEMARAKPEDYHGIFKISFDSYKTMLGLSLVKAMDQKRSAVKRSLLIRRPGCQGLTMDTDSKIAAAGLAISYNDPVTILTRDRGLRYLFGRVKGAMEYKHKIGVPNTYPVPQKNIEFFNPDPHLDESMEKMREAASHN